MTQTDTGRTRRLRVSLPLSRAGFGLGTGILTSEGEFPVEYLAPGDRIITQDRGAVPLARLITRTVPASAMVRVRPSVLDPKGGGELCLSARQQIVLRDWRAMAMFGKPAVLIDIGRLADGAYIERLSGDRPTRLFQLAFKNGRHALYLAGGSLLAASNRLPEVTPV